MRVWHSPWSWLKEIVPLDSVAGNTLMGMFTRLIFRKPFQVAREAIGCLGFIGCLGVYRTVSQHLLLVARPHPRHLCLRRLRGSALLAATARLDVFSFIVL